MEKNISTLLREIKEATGWSEPRLAAELGTSQPTVNRIINGQSECMSSTFAAINTLHKAKCSGVTIDGENPGRRETDRPAP